MASRLLGRYASRLYRASTQVPAAAVVTATRLPSAAAFPTEVQRAQGWPRVTERLMSEGKTVPVDYSPPSMPALTQLDELLLKAELPEDILLAWAEHGGNGNQAAAALLRWAMLVLKTKGKYNDLMEDSRLKSLMDTLCREVSSAWNGNLVAALRALWLMDMPSTAPVYGSVVTEVLWRARKLTYKQLAQLVNWGAHREGQKNVEVVKAALKQLELRWTEIADTKTVSLLIAKGQHMSPFLMDKLEDKALELAESFSAEEIRKVSVSLATQDRRAVPLLRTLSFHLLKKPSVDFTTPLIMDMGFAYGKLNYHNSQVFQRMASELLPRVQELNAADVTRYTKSLAFLKWLHIPLFEAFAEHYTANWQKYTILQLSNLLMAFARMNFQPSKAEEFFSQVHSVLEESLSSLEPILRTDVVWSLCILQQAKPHYLIPLTQQDHITRLSESSAAQLANNQLKLLHIAATLQLEHPGSSDKDTQPPLSASSVQASISPLQSSLRQGLQSLVGDKAEALHTGVDTGYGWIIDGELIVDCDNNPLALTAVLGGGGDQALPEGARRIAFLAWEFPNFGSKSKDLLGRFVMMKRHLHLAGFIIVEIPYYEWLELKTDWQKIAYLKDKMRKAMAEDMAK